MHPECLHRRCFTFTIPAKACVLQNRVWELPSTLKDGRLQHPECRQTRLKIGDSASLRRFMLCCSDLHLVVRTQRDPLKLACLMDGLSQDFNVRRRLRVLYILNQLPHARAAKGHDIGQLT